MTGRPTSARMGLGTHRAKYTLIWFTSNYVTAKGGSTVVGTIMGMPTTLIDRRCHTDTVFRFEVDMTSYSRYDDDILI